MENEKDTTTTPRAGWAEAFACVDPESDEELLPDHLSEEWDETEWTW